MRRGDPTLRRRESQGLGQHLGRTRDDVLHVGHPRWPLPADADDEEWLPYVGACGWAYLTRDKRIRYRPRQRALLERFRMTSIVIAASNNLDLGGQRDLVDQHWEHIEAVLDADQPGIYHLTLGGVALKDEF